MWISSAESHLGLLDSVRSTKRLRVSTLCLLYKIYHRVDYSVNEYVHHLVAARNTRASVALDELGLVVPVLQNGLIQSVTSACS